MSSNLLTRLFAITPKPAAARKGEIRAAGLPGPPGDGPPPSTGAFISPQSLLNFPVAALVIKVAWDVSRSLDGDDNHGWAEGKMFVFWAALVVGAVILLINLETTNPPPKGLRQWVITGFVTLVNCLFLCASALGIDVGIPKIGGSGGSAPTPAVTPKPPEIPTPP